MKNNGSESVSFRTPQTLTMWRTRSLCWLSTFLAANYKCLGHSYFDDDMIMVKDIAARMMGQLRKPSQKEALNNKQYSAPASTDAIMQIQMQIYVVDAVDGVQQ